jgi:hypothetical protein
MRAGFDCNKVICFKYIKNKGRDQHITWGTYLKLDDILCGIMKSGLSDEDIASMARVKPSVVKSVRKRLKDAAFVASLPTSLPLL